MEIVPYKDGVQYIMADNLPMPPDWEKQIAYYGDHPYEPPPDYPQSEPEIRWGDMPLTERDIDNFNHYIPNVFKSMPYVDHVNKLKRQPVGPPNLWDENASFLRKRFKENDYGPLDSLYNVMMEDSEVPQLPQQHVQARALPRTQPMAAANPYFDKYVARRQARPMIKEYKKQYRDYYRNAVQTPGTNEYNERLKKIMTGRRYKRGSKRYARRRRGGGRRYYGRGAYYPSPGTNFGGRMGGYLGATAGEFLGSLGQRAIGLGDYSVNSNVFQGRLPEMTNIAGNGGTIIRYQEYLGDIITASSANTFKIDSYLLNAANSTTFPWLSQIAANYEQYELQGILFEFRSTSANALNSTNTALGTVMLATQYDTVDAPFSSKIEMLNYEYSTSCVPSSNQTHMIECDPHQSTVSVLYTESGEINPPNTDPRLYFLGRTSIATTGFQGTSVNIGELHVTYQVKLLKPKLYDVLGNANETYYALFDTVLPAWSNALPLGLSSSEWDDNVINNMGLTRTGTTLTLPASGISKQYTLFVRWFASTSVSIAYPSLSISNGIFTGPNPASPLSGVTSAVASIYRIFRTSGNNLPTVITFSTGGTLPVAGITFDLTVSVVQTAVF